MVHYKMAALQQLVESTPNCHSSELLSGIDLAHFARVLLKLFSNLSSSNKSSSAQQLFNFDSKCPIFPLKKGTSSQPLYGFPIFQVVLSNVPIFGVRDHRFPIFQVKYLILSSLKKGTSGQPLFGFPIFQDDLQKCHYICHLIFQIFKCTRSIIVQGPFI